MTQVVRVCIVTAAVAAMAGGCSNPADSVPAASVGDSVPAVETSESQPVPALPAGGAAGQFIFGQADSSVKFVGSKVTRSHDGGFGKFAGTIRLVDGTPEGSRVQVEIDTTSLGADNPKLTAHLRSADFFDVKAYPTATFTSTQVTAQGAGPEYAITGNLELKGVTKSLTFPATIDVGEERVTVQAEFSFRRRDFNIVYDGMANDLIRDEVVVRLNIAATRPPAATPAPAAAGADPT